MYINVFHRYLAIAPLQRRAYLIYCIYYKISDRMNFEKQTVWFDAGTKAKVNKLHKKFQSKGVTKSKIVRMFIAAKTFDESVEQLNRDLETE